MKQAMLNELNTVHTLSAHTIPSVLPANLATCHEVCATIRQAQEIMTDSLNSVESRCDTPVLPAEPVSMIAMVANNTGKTSKK